MTNVVHLLKRERPQCEGTTKAGARCSFNARPDSKFCGLHLNKSDEPVESVDSMSLGDKIKAAEQQVMDLVPVAMKTVMEILMNDNEKAADRLKAAQLVLDRGVAQKIQAEVSQSDERDLDAEIEDALEEVRAELDRTGTDG
jgi:hypothetical protein